MKSSIILKEIKTLAGGNVLAQAIGLLAYFILLRIYSPSDYGIFSIFYSYIEVLIILSTGKYELSIVVADSDREALAVARYALRMNAVVSTVLLSVAVLLWLVGAVPGDLHKIGWIVVLIPPMVFFCGSSRVYSFLLNRHHRYATMASGEVVNSASAAIIKILLGLVGLLQSGMPIGTVVGRALGSLRYRIGLRGIDFPRVSVAEQRAVALRHKKYPLYVASKDFMNSLSANLPFLWLSVYFDSAAIGLFSLALTLTFRPVNVFNVAFEQVLYARVAEGVRAQQSIRTMLLQFLFKLNVVALPLFVLAWFVAEPVVVFLFGIKWNGCGDYVRMLLPWVYVSLSSTSLMFISNVFERQRTEFVLYIVLLVLRVVAIAIGIALGSFVWAVGLYATAGMLVSAFLLLWYLSIVQRYERTLTNECVDR